MSVSRRPSSKCRPFAGGVRTFRRLRPTSCAKLVTDPPKGFSRSALTLLSALPWHGNARELQQLVSTLVRLVRRPVIQLDDLLDQVSLEASRPGWTRV